MQLQLPPTLRAATVAVEVARAATVEVEVEVAFEVDPR
jgi:hypothetical protein